MSRNLGNLKMDSAEIEKLMEKLNCQDSRARLKIAKDFAEAHFMKMVDDVLTEDKISIAVLSPCLLEIAVSTFIGLYGGKRLELQNDMTEVNQAEQFVKILIKMRTEAFLTHLNKNPTEND